MGISFITARSLASQTQAAPQGGYILAKSASDARHAEDTVDHLHHDTELRSRRTGLDNATL
jgi:hypothetical protein